MADAEVIREALRRFPLFLEPKPMKVGIRKELIRYCLVVVPRELVTGVRIKRAVPCFLRRWT
ncbi:MAG: hypothetical protein M1346_00480 [Gammaproteobacteria bacterium]|nr:hypothetical protein [Gammaproteobacteria bacterium]